jgi:hypothetical protein
VYAAGSDRPAWQDERAVVLRSLDDGESWTEVFTLPPKSTVTVLAIDPADDGVVYAGGEDCSGNGCAGFVQRTTDGGQTWDRALVTTDTVSSIVVNPLNPRVLFVGDRGYWIRKSADGGDTWTVVRQPPQAGGEPSGHLLAIDPHLPKHVYLGGWGYIAESADGGGTWSGWDDPLNQGTPGAEPQALAVDRGTVTQTLYAGFDGLWAYRRPAPQPVRIYLPMVLKGYSAVGPRYPWTGEISATYPNCTLTRVFGFTLDADEELAGDVWVHYWADGWQGAWARSSWTAFGTDTPWTGDEGNWDGVIDNVPRAGVWHVCIAPQDGSATCISNIVDAVTSTDCEAGVQVVAVDFRQN